MLGYLRDALTDEELARDVVFQRLEGNRPKVAAYVREALKVWQGDGGEVIGYRLNDDERTCEVLTHEVQHAIQDLEGFEGGGNPKMGRHIARERNKLTEMQQMLVDDVKLYDEMMDDERSREKYPLSAFIRDNVRDGVYDEDFGKVLVGMSDEELRGEAERLMGMDGERLDGFEAYRRLAGEVEARNASTRRGMSVDEKRGSLLEETEDVPRENQILQRGDKNNESSTSERTASELGQPTDDSAAVANFKAKVDINSDKEKRLKDLLPKISENGSLGAHELLHELAVAMGSNDGSTDKSLYFDLGDGRTLRLSNHQGNADTFARNGELRGNYGIVVKLSNSRFKSRDDVDYAEFVYFGDRIKDAERQKALVKGLEAFVRTGEADVMPKPDRLNISGDVERMFRGGVPMDTNVSSRVKKAVERIHSEWRGAVSDLASKLGLEGVDVIEGTEGLTEEQRGG